MVATSTDAPQAAVTMANSGKKGPFTAVTYHQANFTGPFVSAILFILYFYLGFYVALIAST
jgi:hypothetical protein